MKVCLIFSPFASHPYVPLGISYLKSFITKNIPFAQVKNLDLSNNFYHNLEKKQFLDNLRHLCQACPRHASQCREILRNEKLIQWMKAALVFKLKPAEFYEVNKYNKLRSLCDVFYREIFACFKRVLRNSLENNQKKDSITLVNNLFKDDINKISSENPNIIGFSIFSYYQLYYSLALAKILKARSNAQIVFGGAFITHLDRRQALQTCNFIDYIIYKEGELGIVALLRNLEKRKFDQVPNLAYRKNGRIIENPEAVVRDLDQIPFPDFSDYNLKNYFSPRPVLSTLFSRGCLWSGCLYCAFKKNYSWPCRTRSIANLIGELKSYQKKGIKHICLADECISAKDLDRINNALLEEKINIYYDVWLRPTKDFTQEVLKRMYRAGGRVIYWGVESFNQRILSLMNKGTRTQEIKKVLRFAHEAGLSSYLYMIQGFPTQTKEEILKDREFLKKISKYIYDFGMHNFRLESGTAVFKNPKKFELKYLRKNYLLKVKRYKLFSPELSFTRKNKVDWKKLNRLLEDQHESYRSLDKFKVGGFLVSRGQTLLHLIR